MEGQRRSSKGAPSSEIKCVRGEQHCGCSRDRSRAFHSNLELRNTFRKSLKTKVKTSR